MKRYFMKWTALCCAIGMICASSYAALAAPLPNESEAQAETLAHESQTLLSPKELYAQTVNSTVGITTSIRTNYFGYSTNAAASGSGFIYSSDGYIITNYHVIEGATSITVTCYDGTQYPAKVVGYSEKHDIAVLKVDADNLTPVVLGSSDDLAPGEEVCAIGNPLGELTFSLTRGIVSAINREITLSSGITMNLIQTDCAINSGNSGGPLFNMYGEVTGITNAKYSSSSSQASIDNIGFAIPIDQVKDLIDEIIEKGTSVSESQEQGMIQENPWGSGNGSFHGWNGFGNGSGNSQDVPNPDDSAPNTKPGADDSFRVYIPGFGWFYGGSSGTRIYVPGQGWFYS